MNVREKIDSKERLTVLSETILSPQNKDKRIN